MASLRKAKKQAKKEGRVWVEPEKLKRRKLAKQVQEQVNIVNKRLRRLDKKGYYNSFSSKKLFERLDGGKINALQKINGKVVGIKLRENMTITDLNAVSRASRNFLASATSSPERLQKVIKKTKNSMYKILKIKDDELTMEDIENYYDMLGDKDFDAFNELIGASEMWALIDEAVESNDSQEDFLSRLLKHKILTNDVDLRKKAINLFNKYV